MQQLHQQGVAMQQWHQHRGGKDDRIMALTHENRKALMHARGQDSGIGAKRKRQGQNNDGINAMAFAQAMWRAMQQ
jgi:hypothetical protein